MNALAITILLVATGVCGFLLYAGMAIYERAKQPRHQHKWERFSEMTVTPRGRPEVLAGHIHGLRCEKCGDITQRYVGLR